MKNKLLKNVFSYSFGNLISKALLFWFGIVVARSYGPVIYGQYNYAVSIVSYFIMFASLGVQSYAVYLIAKEPKRTSEVYSKVLSLEVFFGILATIMLVIFIRIVPSNAPMVFVVGSTIVISALNVDWLYKAKQNFKFVSIQVVANALIQLIIVAIAIICNVTNWIVLPIAVSIAQFISNCYLMYKVKTIYSIKYYLDLKDWTPLIRNGLPFLFSGIFAGINCNIDIVFLGNMVNDKLVGCYSAAYKIINLLTLMVSVVFTPIFPVLVEKFENNLVIDINKLVSKSIKILCIIILPIIIGGIITGERIIVFLFGKEYSGTGIVFIILLVYTAIFYIREIYGYLISASGNQKKYMLITCVSAGSNICMNLLLIPICGIEGAALATVISELINLVLMKINTKKIITLNFENLQFFKIVFAVIVMGWITFILQTLGISIIIIIMVSGGVYALTLYVERIKIK